MSSGICLGDPGDQFTAGCHICNIKLPELGLNLSPGSPLSLGTPDQWNGQRVWLQGLSCARLQHPAVNWPSGTFCGVATGVKRDVAKGSKHRQAGGARPQGAESNSAEGAGRKEQVR